MKETLKISVICIIGVVLVGLAAARHAHVSATPGQTRQAQAVQTKQDEIENLSSQVQNLETQVSTTNSSLCTFIAQHVNTKTVPLPPNCQ